MHEPGGPPPSLWMEEVMDAPAPPWRGEGAVDVNGGGRGCGVTQHLGARGGAVGDPGLGAVDDVTGREEHLAVERADNAR